MRTGRFWRWEQKVLEMEQEGSGDENRKILEMRTGVFWGWEQEGYEDENAGGSGDENRKVLEMRTGRFWRWEQEGYEDENAGRFHGDKQERSGEESRNSLRIKEER